MIFNRKLTWSVWADIFQSIDEFKPLIKEIFLNNNLGEILFINNVTPGTNAVFRVNDYIVKIFVPLEIVDWESNGYYEEVSSITRAISNGVKTPKIVANGLISDLYDFYYIVFDYIDALDFKDVFFKLNKEDKIKFAIQINEITSKLNIKPNTKYNNDYIKERVIKGNRWSEANSCLRKEVFDIVRNYELDNSCYVHGDITKENVMVNNDVYLIDFADSIIAPKEYEYPPILFDLFDFDKDMINAFFDNFVDVDLITKSLCLHDFGGDFVKILVNRFTNKEFKDIKSLKEIKELIKEISG